MAFHSRFVRRACARVAFTVACAFLLAPVQAQEADEALPPPEPTAAPVVTMTATEARAVLAQTLPPTAPLDERIDLAVRQRTAARVVGEQASMLAALDQLVSIGKGRPEWSTWTLDAMNTQFVFGSQQRSLEIGEMLVAQKDLAPVLRSNALANLTWRYCAINDKRNCERVYANAVEAFAALPKDISQDQRDFTQITNLQAKGEVLRNRGDADGRVNALREAVAVARRYADRRQAEAKGDVRNFNYRGAINTYDYTSGQLVYALIAQGRGAEAIAISQDGLARAKLQDLGPDALGSWGQRLGSALSTERRYEEALAASRAALAELARTGSQSSGLQVSLAHNGELLALVNLERWQEADRTYTAFLNSIRDDRVAYDRAHSPLLVALLAAKSGRTDEALKMLENTIRYRVRNYGNGNPLTAEARAVRGAVNLVAGNPVTAMSDYEDFFSAYLEASSGWLDLAPVGARGAYLDIVMREYLKYAMRLYTSGGAAAIDGRMTNRLVQVSDRLGSGIVQRALLESTAKVRTGDPALTALVFTEQEQRAKLRGAFSQIYADSVAIGEAKDAPEEKKKQLNEQLKKDRDESVAAQKILDDTRRQLATRFPAYIKLVNPVSPNVETIRRALLPNEAFLDVFTSRDGTLVWAINANGKTALHFSSWTDRDVATRVKAMRAQLDVGDRLPRLPAMDFAPALALHDELVKPVRAALAGATVLDVSAEGALASIPFAALVSGPATDAKTAPWLAKEFAIAQTPGASAFVTLRGVEVRAAAGKALIGFGDPQFRAGQVEAAKSATPKARNLVVAATSQSASSQAASYSAEQGFRYAAMPPLPETREELTAIAAALGADPKTDLVLGAAATRRAVITTPLDDRRVVAFATHGLLPGEIPNLSKPALAMAATDDPADTPLLSLDDVLALKLNAQWVVLSACNTAGGERDGTAMSGLVRGFFFAGTRSVLATHWAVESESARQLVSTVFSAGDGKTARAASLQRAQAGMIDGTIGNGAYAHPYYWAPYALFGDPSK